MSIRITRDIKNNIVASVWADVSPGVVEKWEGIKDGRAVLAVELYNKVYNKKMRNWMNTCPEDCKPFGTRTGIWLHDIPVKLRFGHKSGELFVVRGGDELLKVVASQGTLWYSYMGLPNNLKGRVNKVLKEALPLDKVKQRLEGDVIALCDSANTLSDLHVIWPDGKKYIAAEEARHKKDTRKAAKEKKARSYEVQLAKRVNRVSDLLKSTDS